MRQRGSKFVPGNNVRKGKDDTLYSIAKGIVKFTTKKFKKFDGNRKIKKVVSVEAK